MANDDNPQSIPPLGWAASADGPDISSLINRAQVLAQALVAADGQQILDSMPDGYVCESAALILETLNSIRQVLESGEIGSQRRVA